MDQIITFLSKSTTNNKIKEQVIELLLANGAQINTPPLIHDVKKNMDQNITFLSKSTTNKEIKKQVIELLLANGAQINRREGDYFLNSTPPLIHAVKNNLFDIYKILIDNGADVNLPNPYEGNTPLMYASNIDNIEIVKDLIKHGANVNVKNKYRETALTLKYRSENIELIKCLIENGANVNIKDSDGYSLLLRAYNHNNIKLVTYLIEQTDVVIPTEEKIKYYFDRRADRNRFLSEMKTIIERRYLEVIGGMINEYEEGDINDDNENEKLIGIIYDLHDMNYFSIVSDYLIRK